MRSKGLPLTVLVAALAALVASVGWAATRNGDDGWSMMRYGTAGMMGYAENGDSVANLPEAKRQAQRFADRLDLRVGEVMRFTNNYYAELVEKNGRLATEVLVEPETGNVYLEYGPAMMWNTRYGMMSDFRLRDSGGMMGGGVMGGSSTNSGMMGGSGGMMGGSGGMMGGYADPTWSPGTTTADVPPAQARRIAQRWLDRQGSGVTAAEPDVFPGYYTLHVLRNGRIAGMLSVNAATGAVWSHWWHGRFISMLES